jgi:hypothetical protein
MIEGMGSDISMGFSRMKSLICGPHRAAEALMHGANDLHVKAIIRFPK